MTGDYMEEDSLCTHRPGTFAQAAKLLSPPAIQYGSPAVRTIEWESEALERMEQIPAFVRGMVTRSVESYCKKNGITTVTRRDLDALRSKMPASKIFGKQIKSKID